MIRHCITRRAFARTSAGTAAALAVGLGAARAAASEKIVLGFMGLGGRGTALLGKFAERKDVEVAWLCDPDTRRLGKAREMVEKLQGRAPKVEADFRRMLEDKGVDAVVNATPDHWHVPGAVLACQAGKDVYIEKPMAHGIWEGRKLIEAADRHQRVIQVGMQSRSCGYVRTAREFIRSGRLGDVHLVRVHNMMKHPPMGPPKPQDPPEGFDYDLWCGPAAKLPYDPSRRWLNFWEYSCGPIAGDAVHQLDLARYLMGDPPAAKTVTHTGGILALKDGRDTPDTQIATLEHESFTLLFQASLWTGYMKKIAPEIRDGDLFPDWPFCATKIEILGTQGCMYVGRHGGGWQAFDAEGKPTEQAFGRQGDAAHIENFLSCIRSREQPAANAVQGHLSGVICHLANVAFRAGRRTLAFDGKSETFLDCPEANVFLKRATYRAPWVMPDPV